ncbi:hypothetical protein EVAR_57273_1 [Eumeta japonica]|uniref:Uncharacterized protein n=1 Tax=Eumeta variegata TaxID=151549 RepID=A0A4C1ZU09_EUMVA|nr:hypothetical protein EVAR_57273_1 [Eumeta japonica]
MAREHRRLVYRHVCGARRRHVRALLGNAIVRAVAAARPAPAPPTGAASTRLPCFNTRSHAVLPYGFPLTYIKFVITASCDHDSVPQML